MQRKDFIKKAFCLMITPVFSVIGTKVIARPMDDNIPTKGEWPGGDSVNSFLPSHSVVVTLSGNALYISGAACGSPVAVSINGIGFIYHDFFADSDANNIMIDLSSAPSGVYSLHITNLLGGYLDGSFNL